MSLRNIDFDAAFRRVADRRIEEAMKEGKFDSLPGMGKDIEYEPMPASENARLMWWALRILKQNDVVPDEVRWRKSIDLLKATINRETDETKLESLVNQVNDLVRKLNTLGTNAINLEVCPIDLEAERLRLRERTERP
jgi:hypothetical protein